MPTPLKYTCVCAALDKTTFTGHYAFPLKYTGVCAARDKTTFTGQYAYPVHIH
jgi:hypothetical protein